MANSPLLAQRRLRFQSDSAGVAQFAVIQAFAPSLGLEVSTINVVDAPQIDRAVMAFACEPNGGLIVTANPSTVVHRQLIIALAARHKLPAVYFDRAPVETLIWLCNSDKRPAM